MKSTYVCLLNYTDQGLRNLKESPQRATAFCKQIDAAGLKVLAQLWTAGAYDGVLIVEGEEQAALTMVMELASLGNVRVHSLRAFDASEFAGLLQK